MQQQFTIAVVLVCVCVVLVVAKSHYHTNPPFDSFRVVLVATTTGVAGERNVSTVRSAVGCGVTAVLSTAAAVRASAF